MRYITGIKLLSQPLKNGDGAELEKELRKHYFDAGERMYVVSQERSATE
jgi:hypothetical protein